MNAPLVTTTSLTTPIAKPQQYQHGLSVEESRDKRLQRQQARFRDRGGIYVPKPRGTLLNILLKGGTSPTKDGRRSRSRSRSQSPVKGGNQNKEKGKAQRDAIEKSNPVASKTTAKKRKSMVQKEEIAAGPSTSEGTGVTRRKVSRTTQSRSRKRKVDELTSEEATAQSKSKTARRSTISKVTSTAKSKEREEVEENAPKPKRTVARATRKTKAAESDNVDAGTDEEEHDALKKPPAKARARKPAAKRKTPTKAGRKAKVKVADAEDEESGGEKDTSEVTTRKGKGRAQAKANAKSRGRAKVKQDISQGTANETEDGPVTISVSRGKRRADKAKSQSNYGGLSVIAEEEEPISQTSSELGSDVEKPHANAGRGTKESTIKEMSRPGETPSGTQSAQAPSTGSRKRKQDEVPPPADAAPSQKKAKLTPAEDTEKDVTKVSKSTSGGRGGESRRESDALEDAAGVAGSSKQTINSKPSTSRKRESNETQPELVEKGKSARKATKTKRTSVDDDADGEARPPAKKRTKAGHAVDSEIGERLKTTSSRQKENSKASGRAPSRKKLAPKSSSPSKAKKPVSVRRRGPPKEILEQIKRSQPHVEDGEPDELDLLT